MIDKLSRLLFGTLRRRLSVGIGLVMSVMAVLFILDMTRQQEAWVIEHQSRQTAALVQTLAKLSANALLARDIAALQEIVDELAGYPELRHALVADHEGQVLAHSNVNLTGLYLTERPAEARLLVLHKDSHLIDVISPVMLSGRAIGWVRVGLSSAAFHDELAQLRHSALVHMLFAIALSLLVAALTGRYLTRRLDVIEQTADAVQGGDTARRAALSGNDEAARLARRFNEMLDSLARQQAILQENEAKFRTIYDTINDAIFILDAGSGRILDVNTGACQMLGYRREQLLELDIAALSAGVPPYTQAAMQEHLGLCNAHGWNAFEWLTRDSTGRLFWVAVNLKAFKLDDGQRILAVIRDIDQRKQLEVQMATTLDEQRTLNKKLEEAHNQLLQSEKMASLGQLAAGVAHELNNPIGFVHSNLGTLKTYLDDIFEIATACETAAAEAANPADFARIQALKAEKDFDYLKGDIFQLLTESRDGLQRVKKIVQDLKNFSRPGETEWQWADLHRGLDSTLNIVWNELKYKCTVKKDYGELPQVRCLPSQLNQVFMNLLVNAGHAIAEQGEITIATAQNADGTVCISVSDTGQGIPAEHIPHIFEPFFTTKPIGKGTGLGLSIAWGIINKHHGKIEVASEVGKGTTFTITLPIEQPGDDRTAASGTTAAAPAQANTLDIT